MWTECESHVIAKILSVYNVHANHVKLLRPLYLTQHNTKITSHTIFKPIFKKKSKEQNK